MNRLILIGNGFDLAHGLKTSYRHFINNFWENKIKEILSSELIETPEGLFYYEDDFVKASAIMPIWELVRKSEDEKYKGFNLFSTFSPLPIKTIPSNVCDATSFICKNNLLNKISEKQYLDKWVDIEYEYYMSLLECLDNKNDVSILNNEFQSIQNAFQNYLSNVCSNMPSMNLNIRSNMFSSISENDSILFLNFNYTRTLKSYTYATRGTQIINIHGELNNEDNPIIFGFGDEIDDNFKKLEKTNNKYFLEYVKSIKYSLTDNYRNMLSFIGSNDYQVYIMGLSCGLSDRTLLNTIFENKYCKSIKIFYHQRDIADDNFLETYINISRNFNDKKLLRSIVLPKPQCVPLVS